MKALIPFILPLVVLIVIGFAFWRWMQNNSTEPSISDTAESIEITQLDDNEKTDLATGTVNDVPSVSMVAPEGAPEEAKSSRAQVRYQIRDNAVSLLVLANLIAKKARATSATSTDSSSQEQTEEASQEEEKSQKKFVVWFKPANKATLTRAFSLEEGKGGLIGSASVGLDALPMEVYITDTETMSDVPTNTWFRAVIPAPSQE